MPVAPVAVPVAPSPPGVSSGAVPRHVPVVSALETLDVLPSSTSGATSPATKVAWTGDEGEGKEENEMEREGEEEEKEEGRGRKER